MELNDYLRSMRAHWAAIVGAALLGILIAGGWSLMQPRVYTAEASGYVAATGANDLGSSMIGDQLAQSKVKSYLTIGSWRTVAESAIHELGLDASPESVVGRVTVTNPTDTVVLKVSAKANTPEAARDLAEAWTRGMIEEIASIEGANGVAPAVTLVPGDSARLPASPSSPNVKQNLALGLLVGLLLGVGYALVRDHLDRRVRSSEGVEKATGLAVIGALPLEPSLVDHSRLLGLDQTGGGELVAMGEALRGLRTNLQYMSVDDPPRAIVVTSALPGDGKSTTAANLAVTLAASGQRTVLIDADLRRPSVATLFGVPGDAGLSDVLAGRASVEDVIQPIGTSSGALSVLAAGPIPPNPSEILGSDRMRQLIKGLSATSFVIIDSPPLLPVTDAAMISPRADGALIVVSTGKTAYEELALALDSLEKANGKALGVVLNRVPTSGAGALYFGYQYKGDHYASDPRAVTVDAPVNAGSGSRPARHR